MERAKLNEWTALPFFSGNTQILGAKLVVLSLCLLRNEQMGLSTLLLGRCNKNSARSDFRGALRSTWH